MGGSFDWDKARMDKLVADRGTEPLDLPSGRPARQAAPVDKQKAAIAGWRAEFRALSYNAQLAYLTDLRRRLARLQGSDEVAAETIKAQFKPLLKKPAAPKMSSTERPPARGSTQARQRQSSRLTDVKGVVVQLVAKRPGRLTQKQCAALLAGTDLALRDDPSFGSLASITKASLLGSIRSLTASGVLAIDKSGGLVPAGHSGHAGQETKKTKHGQQKPERPPQVRSNEIAPDGHALKRYARPWRYQCSNCGIVEPRQSAFFLVSDKSGRRPLCITCYRTGHRLR